MYQIVVHIKLIQKTPDQVLKNTVESEAIFESPVMLLEPIVTAYNLIYHRLCAISSLKPVFRKNTA